MKIVKLDTRFTGHEHFTHYVSSSVSKMSQFETIYSGIELFLRWRNWLWEVYGPGTEIGLYHVAQKLDLSICWGWDTRAEHDTRFAKNRLYFTKEEYLSAFLLQWDVK